MLRFRGLGPQAGAGRALSGDVQGASCGEASTSLQASGNLCLTEEKARVEQNKKPKPLLFI